MGNKTKPSIFEVNVLYLLLGIILLLLGSLVQNREIYSGLLITEYILILLPSLLFLYFKRYPIKKVLRLNRISFKQILMVILITIFTYPLAIFLQAIFLSILSYFKDITPNGVPLPEDGIQYIISFFIIAISPGICEEVMFRGVMLDAYEKIGRNKSIIITAFLFGIFHFTVLNMIGPFLIGIVFGIMVYKTNSLYSSIIGHTVNNGIALTLGYFINKYSYLIDELGDGATDAVSMDTTVKMGFGIILFLGICLTIVITLLRRLSAEGINKDFVSVNYLDYYKKDTQTVEINTNINKLSYIPVFIVIIIFIFVNWKYILI